MLDSSSSAREQQMADHFMEVVGIRLTAVDERVDTEIAAMQGHLAELRLAVHDRVEDLRGDMRDGFRALTVRMDRLDVRMDRLDGRVARLEMRFDGMAMQVGRLEG